jgi:osmotically-inducible protein OsmY
MEIRRIMYGMGNSHLSKADHRIAEDIRAEVAMCRDVADSHSVDITVQAGVVQLAGSTETYSQKWTIGRAAGRVIGVREVRDYLEVRPRTAAPRSDGQIEQAAAAALHWDARVPDSVSVSVTDGVLRLDGVVERFSDREAAEESVRNLIGLRDLVNEIRVAPIQAPANLQSEVEAAIRRRFAFACRFLGVSVDRGVVSLRGNVPTFGTLDEVERAVQSIAGVKRIDNQLLVAGEEEAS